MSYLSVAYLPVFIELQGNAYYIVADGAYGNHTLAHINEAVDEKRFNVNVTDLTDKIGIISIQGPNRYLFIYPLTWQRFNISFSFQFKN